MTADNLFTDIPARLPEELFTELVAGREFHLERIVSRGHVTPADEWYDQPRNEWVMVLKGKAELAFEGAPSVTLEPGDHLVLPAHCRHRVTWTDPEQDTVWLALHYS